MRFFITRTSISIYNPIQPCEEATRSKVLNDYGIPRWEVSITTLKQLLELNEKYGGRIILNQNTIGESPEIEIYDDYRE